jgi:Tol biopolymer transport system component
VNACTVAISGVLVSAIAAGSAGLPTPAPKAALGRDAGPSGTIAFVDGRGGISTIGADGSHRRRIVAAGENPAWSPNGRYIAYSAGDLFVVRADGTRRRRLTDAPLTVVDTAYGPQPWPRWADWGPAWSPDGRRIVFYRDFVGNRVDLFVVDVATRRVVRLTRTPDFWEFNPAWSPDGRKILFEGEDGIYVLELATKRVRTLVADFELQTPDWSPTGSRIAYSSGFGLYGGAIVVMKADGSRQRRIITSRAHLGSPSWSPDGSWIAYNSFGSGEGANRRPGWLFTARADGKRQHALIRDGSDPDWQPG